jgi:predicted RNase H-like nuclease (RuvC/YqgF family)
MHRRPTVLPPTEGDSSSSNTKNPNGKVKANEKVNTMFKWKNICSFLFISTLIGIIIALNIERQGNIEALLYWKQKETQWKEESSLASALRLDMKTLLEEKDRLHEDSVMLEGAIEKLSRTIEELKSENDSLKNQMKDDEEKNNLLQSHMQVIQSQLTQLRKKVQSSARVAALEK